MSQVADPVALVLALLSARGQIDIVGVHVNRGAADILDRRRRAHVVSVGMCEHYSFDVGHRLAQLRQG